MDFNCYGRLLLEANGLSYCDGPPWVFKGGMSFTDSAVWWPSDWLARPVPHEGLDLVHFQTDRGLQMVEAGFMVVAPVSGVVVEICHDYLAKTVWLSADHDSGKLVVLCHIKPKVVVGQRLCCGDPVGVVDYPPCTVPLHLHLSVLTGDWQSIETLSWDTVHRQSHARFTDPSF